MTVMRFQCRVNPHSRHVRGTTSDGSSGGDGGVDTVIHGKADVVLDDVTGPLDTANAARHIQGDLTVKGTMYANKVISATTYGTCDPKSKGQLRPLTASEVAQEMQKLRFFKYESKHDPGFQKWGYNAHNVQQLNAGNFVRDAEHNPMGYMNVDLDSLNAGSSVLVMELWHTMQAMQAQLQALRKETSLKRKSTHRRRARKKQSSHPRQRHRRRSGHDVATTCSSTVVVGGRGQRRPVVARMVSVC